jgi:dienelactone hydrolase
MPMSSKSDAVVMERIGRRIMAAPACYRSCRVAPRRIVKAAAAALHTAAMKLPSALRGKPWTQVLLALVLACAWAAGAWAGEPETVHFPSADRKTKLVGYVWKPDSPGPHPAVVMLHGRSGPYSSLAQGTYTAATLSLRHRMWGEFWASRGYLALHVDSFGPRGYAQGFPRYSYRDRPREVSEQFVRPLDAYGALAYLRGRPDVIGDRIGLHGWSNGAMTVLSALGPEFADIVTGDEPRFRAAIAQYPGCRNQIRDETYVPSAPLLMLIAGSDEEVSPEVCSRLASRIEERGAAVEFVRFDGAQHAYDDPGRRRQSHAPNRAALVESLLRAEGFFARFLASPRAAGGR